MANYQSFLIELCSLLGVAQPDPTMTDDRRNAYVFERAVPYLHSDIGNGTGRIDLYKRGCFVLETKQGVDRHTAADPYLKTPKLTRKGHAVRGTGGWDTAIYKAKEQAERNRISLFVDGFSLSRKFLTTGSVFLIQGITMKESLTVGFIGFGEAGFEIAKGLHAAGAAPIFFCHLHRNDPQRAALARRRACESGATALDSSGQVAGRSDYILSVVPPEASLAAAESAVPHLGPGKVYLDLTSSSPEEMRAAAMRVEASGAAFIDGAMTGSLPVEGLKVLIYVSGREAERVAQRFNGYGMNLQAVGPEPGQASAIKLILSVATKGFEALLVEMLLAAHHFRVEAEVMQSLNHFFARGLDGVVNRFVGSDAVYAGRRVREMESSVNLLEKLGVEPLMARATVQRLQWSASLGLSEKFGGVPPAGYREVIQAWEEIGLFKKP